MDENQTLDNQLAEITDALLGGREVKAHKDLEREERVLRLVLKAVAPQERIDPAFQQRLTRTITEEWDQLHSRRSLRNSPTLFFTRSYARLAATAAAFALVLMAVLLTVISNNSEQDQNVGTVVGFDSPLVPLLILVVLGVVSVTTFYLWNRRK